MSTINFHLHDGSIIEAEMASYSATDLLGKLNDPKIMVVSIGDKIVSKNMVKLVAPKQPDDKVWVSPIKVTLQDGLIVKTEDATFNTEQVTSTMNDFTNSMIVIGDLVVAKNSIRMIDPDSE